ncbi:MAG TPA: nuclear transport factor 2 family protein [Acidimicrobiales bacterium]|nr:nuclear transport factor 2 family protein [Acidimicrobiales bacterium]
MDWTAWAQKIERSSGVDEFEALFAAERAFRDPVTPWTSDVRAVAEHTAGIFPDWAQRVASIRGGEDWAVFEWTGGGTYRGPGAENGPGFPVTMEGATVVEVDAEGRVTRWRDYLDTNEAITQVMAGLQAGGVPPVPAGDLTADWEAHFSDEPQL